MLLALENAAHEGTIKRYIKDQQPQPFYGVPMGVISKLAKEFKSSSDQWLDLWATKNLDAQVLAVLLANPKKVTDQEIVQILNTRDTSIIVWDKFNDKLLSKLADQEKWINFLELSNEPIHHRLKWGLRVRLAIAKKFAQDEANQLLDEILSQMKEQPEIIKWVMNRCLVEIALNYPTLFDKAYQESDKLGVYKDMKVSPGCTSAFAPYWIDAVLKNKEKRAAKNNG